MVDAHLASLVLGNGYKLNKALEPPLSDELLSMKGHPTMFSAGTDSEYWALTRKGTAPAFNPRHIRSALSCSVPQVHETTTPLLTTPNVLRFG